MIEVIPTTGGTYNLIGTDGGMFVLQGNLTKAQLVALQKQIAKALKEKS